MKRLVAVAGILVLTAGAALAGPASKSASKSSSDKWLHVRVEDGTGADAEIVHVNVPLSLAEAVIPAINVDNFRNGKVHVGMSGENSHLQDVDIRKILTA